MVILINYNNTYDIIIVVVSTLFATTASTETLNGKQIWCNFL